MKIGELFVSLGVKGTNSAARALKGTKDGLGEVKSMGLEAKAMIAAVVYGLERLMSQSAQMGQGLLNTSTYLGESTKTLQEWQYAARQAGMSADELSGNFKSVQGAVMSHLSGQGAIAGMSYVAEKVGLDYNRLRDLPYLFLKSQEFAQSVPEDVGNMWLKTFGYSERMISLFRRNAFTPEMFARAPKYSDSEIKALARADAAWANLGQHIEMAFGRFNASHGQNLVSDISKLTNSIIKLVEALLKLAETFHIFEGIDKIATVLANKVNDISENTKNSDAANKKLYEDAQAHPIKGMWDLITRSVKAGILSPTEILNPNFLAPKVAPFGPAPTSSVQFHQSLHFQHDGKDAQRTGDSTHKAVRDAYRQMGAQRQGS